jgi:hypothetical protein
MNTINSLVAFHDTHGRKADMIFVWTPHESLISTMSKEYEFSVTQIRIHDGRRCIFAVKMADVPQNGGIDSGPPRIVLWREESERENIFYIQVYTETY